MFAEVAAYIHLRVCHFYFAGLVLKSFELNKKTVRKLYNRIGPIDFKHNVVLVALIQPSELLRSVTDIFYL